MKTFLLTKDKRTFMTPESMLAILISAVGGFVLPLSPYLGLTLSLCLTDLYTGIRASGEPVQSKKLRRTVEKFIVYAIAIMLAEGMGAVFFGGHRFLTHAMAFIICSIEFKSNLENIGKVTNNDLWSLLRKYLGDKFKAPTDGKR